MTSLFIKSRPKTTFYVNETHKPKISPDMKKRSADFMLSSEYIDYHLSPETTSTVSPNLPRIVNGKDGHTLNVTAQIGSPVSLQCVVKNLQDKTVSI